MADFRFQVNVQSVAAQLNATADQIRGMVNDAVQKLSIAAHAFIVKKAQDELKGYKLETFMGENGRNVRWSKVTNGIWVVEIDPSVRWIEEGRPATSMATESWLLKPGKVKRAKDGSVYRSIPMPQLQGAGKTPGFHPMSPAIEAIAKAALKENKINLTKIERNPDGSPRFGILHTIKDMDKYDPGRQLEGFHSKPITPEESAKTGLHVREGIFFLQGLAVVQRPNAKAKHGVTKEAITFRTVSSKHNGTSHWMQPPVPALASLQAAYEHAQQQWVLILKEMDAALNRRT
jgi:hypothetical protein